MNPNNAKFNWVQDHKLTFGETWQLETPQGEITLTLDEGLNDGVLHYSRTPEGAEEPEQVHTLILEKLRRSEEVALDFLPVYPDRPIVFSLENPLTIPPGHRGFFFLTFYLDIGVTVRQTETVIERIYPGERKKSYWGPPHNGISVYGENSSVYTNPIEIMNDSSTATAVVPIYYHNEREEGDNIERCLVPMEELDIYRNEDDDLVFEVVRLRQLEEFYQEPQPLKRPPNEIQENVSRFQSSPEEAKSLFEKVKSLPRLDSLSYGFLNR